MNKSVSSLPAWFQRWGIGAWLVVGMVLVLIGAVWLLEDDRDEAGYRRGHR